MSSSAENRRRAVQAARGEIPFDLLLTGAQIVDMVTGELRAAAAAMPGNSMRWMAPTCRRD